MARNKTVAQPQNAMGEGGYTGYAGVQAVDSDIPENFRPAVVYKNARGHFVDAYGRRVKAIGTKQEAGIAGSDEQKQTVQYAPVEEVDAMESEGFEDEDTEGETEDEVNS